LHFRRKTISSFGTSRGITQLSRMADSLIDQDS
jgi:hypothetical protein